MLKPKKERGSVEMITIALLAALIVVLAIPLLTSIGKETQNTLTDVKDSMLCANNSEAPECQEDDPPPGT